MKRKFEIFLSFSVLIIALGFSIWAINYLKIFNKQVFYRLNAEFTDTTQIQSGAEVRIAGITVGRVVKKWLDNETFTSRLIIEITQNIKIPKDSELIINSSGLLAASHLKIAPGVSKEYLQNLDNFSNTKSSVPLEELIGRAIFTLSESGKE